MRSPFVFPYATLRMAPFSRPTCPFPPMQPHPFRSRHVRKSAPPRVARTERERERPYAKRRKALNASYAPNAAAQPKIYHDRRQ